jgi:uncharacterized protein
MTTILITGGTGLIGQALTQLLLSKNYRVIILTRAEKLFPLSSNEQLRYAHWSIDKQYIDAGALQQADYIVHLAGENVAAKRWTAKRKQQIQESRINSSQLLVKALQEHSNKVKALISGSAIGWYGPDAATKNISAFSETDPAHTDFLGTTCQQWEASIAKLAAMNNRLVILRTGIVLSNSGGAWPAFKKPITAGIATILGSGQQIISWIHLQDMCRIIIHALENEQIEGIYNAVAPHPVSNKMLNLAIGQRLRGKFFIPIHIPSFIIKIMLGEMSVEVLKSTTVSAEKIQATGFQFSYPTIEAAVNELVKGK